MQTIVDLHLHSRFSRACSKEITLENIDKTCRIKGVKVIGTSDFTHPIWFKEMKEQLVEKEPGLYVLKKKNKMDSDKNREANNDEFQTRFMCTTEISCIYTKGGKCRRLHVLIFAPSLEVVEKINLDLERAGCNLKSDGRPIIGMDVKDLAKLCWRIDERCMIVPAHIWTPWFGMYGSKSGFDSFKECWEEVSDKIYAIETGISSDPTDSWRIKNLDKVSIISNSDAHSLPNIAREANVFEIAEKDLSFDKICKTIKESDSKSFLFTIEFYPEEGRYHWDGHRECNFSCKPEESKKLKNICPVCRRPLTIGVMNRVQELAEEDRTENFVNPSRIPFKKLIELDKIIAQALNIKSRKSKRVQQEYKNLIDKFNELEILLKIDYKKLEKITLPEIVEGIRRVREGKVKIIPGFDGEYGKIQIFNEDDKINMQKKLF